MPKLEVSNAFIERCDTLSLEAIVKAINVNYEKGGRILARCKALKVTHF